MPIHHHYHHHNPPAIVIKVGDERPVPLTLPLKQEYERMYAHQLADLKFATLLEANLAKITFNAPRYREVEAKTKIPWYVVGIMHLLECDARFDCHLHNGDPLDHKTVHVPAGRPPLDKWTWEDSAVDALELEKTTSWDARGLDPNDWSLGATLYRLEAWNGFGSRSHGVPTPYLWSGTRFYTDGKYGSDGRWNPKLKSQQVGAAPLLKGLNKKGVIHFPSS